MAPASFHHEKVCVMDASGRLGSTLVERLLQRGYTVHAAVQGHGDLKFNGVAAGENKKLKVFRADPFDYQSIIDALKGCSGLFYAFEPPEDHLAYDTFSTNSCTLKGPEKSIEVGFVYDSSLGSATYHHLLVVATSA
ncbi:hypothetical protein SCA6_004934 [Theobroma cacao]